MQNRTCRHQTLYSRLFESIARCSISWRERIHMMSCWHRHCRASVLSWQEQALTAGCRICEEHLQLCNTISGSERDMLMTRRHLRPGNVLPCAVNSVALVPVNMLQSRIELLLPVLMLSHSASMNERILIRQDSKLPAPARRHPETHCFRLSLRHVQQSKRRERGSILHLVLLTRVAWACMSLRLKAAS